MSGVLVVMFIVRGVEILKKGFIFHEIGMVHLPKNALNSQSAIEWSAGVGLESET